MYEAVIRYDNPKVLDVLLGISGFFGFTVATAKDAEKVRAVQSAEVADDNYVCINGHKVLKGTGDSDPSDMAAIFSKLDLDAGQLRKETWQRRRDG